MPWRRGDINGRSHRHAASHFRHVLSLHDEAHLEPLNPQFVLSRRVAFDLVVEAGEDDPCAHGQFASLDLFQAAAPEQACHLVALLVLPNRRQSLVSHRCAVVLRVGLSQVYPRKIMECPARLFFRSLPKLCTGVQGALFLRTCAASSGRLTQTLHRLSSGHVLQVKCSSPRGTRPVSCPSANHKSSH